jgi:uncharacterized protein YjbJ (UPF0337 family)
MDPDRIQGTIRNAAGHAEEAVGDLAGNTRLQAEGLADRAAGAAQNAYGRAKDVARDALDRAPDAWNEAVGTGQDYARRGAGVVRERMGDQPLALLLVAGAIGYLLGWAIHGRN